MAKQVEDLTAADAEKLLDLFVECCRVGAALDIPPSGMAGTLQAFAKCLERAPKRPLQHYVDNPRGELGRALNEIDVEEAKVATAARMEALKGEWNDF